MTMTPHMGLTKPDVSTTVGPLWAQEINEDLDTLDSHDHSSGKGAAIKIFTHKYVTTTPIAIQPSDSQKVIICLSGAATLNLPVGNTEMYLVFKRSTSGALSIVPNGTDLIDGANSALAISSAQGSARLFCDGSNSWYTV